MRSEDALAAAAWAAVAALGVAAGVGWISIESLESLRLCVFRAMWGVPCPGCGMGHALLEFFSGDWIASFAFHPLGPLVAVGWTAWTGRTAARALTRPFAASLVV
ncbi:MAG: hypothetical protein AUJ52_09850 [Elusimicrobia bacterium CG1_02_63_36]|nr:MAG: hypothetical protein AUJ52_09850 [Elusimicrobia bacterium CG1_02_63_36]PIP84282.1 MAG: hypothetical protein COR54_04850 [Elusimicrobia bacterium CG22_combo_CG10-13_8_21_14_all_63_91]PJA15651.1 MAG: hypothetical protein COX66_09420 [Elusimicrobia bacterium CG_4_10_14_0_2_um_filter_63_34]PJB23711.1 MAG: hypothetical protein CO113_17355 [Elusimicrobia bacterium CG_4_9_14_3_um_filter_62_55]